MGNFYENQIYTAHGVFGTYQERFFHKNPICDCGEEIGSVEHLIMRCKRWASYGLSWPKNWATLDILKLMRIASCKKDAAKIIKLQLASILRDLDTN
ncbi:hypothetical protein AVEN_266023-1 [Araneus ventricosus]|uniref:Reverse transcriptase zinc-binding domain-containing protein n=1 Tax=Araneus ventricosus TaxID=182803 RepID=A0A4Y2IL48_ARAVE|nr:hypothetical protein AVEN_266023-1 [Araneus ventricosus]